MINDSTRHRNTSRISFPVIGTRFGLRFGDDCHIHGVGRSIEICGLESKLVGHLGTGKRHVKERHQGPTESSVSVVGSVDRSVSVENGSTASVSSAVEASVCEGVS